VLRGPHTATTQTVTLQAITLPQCDTVVPVWYECDTKQYYSERCSCDKNRDHIQSRDWNSRTVFVGSSCGFTHIEKCYSGAEWLRSYSITIYRSYYFKLKRTSSHPNYRQIRSLLISKLYELFYSSRNDEITVEFSSVLYDGTTLTRSVSARSRDSSFPYGGTTLTRSVSARSRDSSFLCGGTTLTRSVSARSRDSSVVLSCRACAKYSPPRSPILLPFSLTVVSELFVWTQFQIKSFSRHIV